MIYSWVVYHWCAVSTSNDENHLCSVLCDCGRVARTFDSQWLYIISCLHRYIYSLHVSSRPARSWLRYVHASSKYVARANPPRVVGSMYMTGTNGRFLTNQAYSTYTVHTVGEIAGYVKHDERLQCRLVVYYVRQRLDLTWLLSFRYHRATNLIVLNYGYLSTRYNNTNDSKLCMYYIHMYMYKVTY